MRKYEVVSERSIRLQNQAEPLRSQKVAVVLPTHWDRKQIEAVDDNQLSRFRIEWLEPSDEECRWDFDILGFIDEVSLRLQSSGAGVFSSSDYPGSATVAAVCKKLGLAGPSPEAVFLCSHKFYSRQLQKRVVPEATPPFQLVDPYATPANLEKLHYPCFVKPVRGAFSRFARRVDSAGELGDFLKQPAVRQYLECYLNLYNRLLERLTGWELDAGYFIGEELLAGKLFTLEGFSIDEEVTIVGIVDSVCHPVTGSFLRFDYPSRLPGAVRQRAAEITRRIISAIGLDRVFFNIEMIWNPVDDRISIVEINPRICGQFADLYQKVDGTSSYLSALLLATGRNPTLRRGEGPHKVSSSVPLRIFYPVEVLSTPDEEQVKEIEERFPGTMIWLECSAGDRLVPSPDQEDGQSCRYAVVNLGGESWKDLEEKLEQIRQKLAFQFAEI